MNTNENLYPSSANELIKNFSDMILNFGKKEKKIGKTQKYHMRKKQKNY